MLGSASSHRSPLADRYKRFDEGSGPGSIAQGSFGKVYAALDTVSQETVAVKRQMLPSDSAAKELAWYKALGPVGHPHLMCLRDHFVFGRGGGRWMYMVFDFMDTNLWAYWNQRRRVLPMPIVVSLIRNLAGALGHLHFLGIVHADLSMANMLLQCASVAAPSQDTSTMVLRVADFGGAVNAGSVMLPAQKVITTEYARAPEVIMGERSLTATIDLWALGITCMALVCGSLVFYRIDGVEPIVLGLENTNSDDHVAPEHHVLGIRTLRNQVAVLGPITSAFYRRCGDLPQWPQVCDVVSGRALRERSCDVSRMLCMSAGQWRWMMWQVLSCCLCCVGILVIGSEPRNVKSMHFSMTGAFAVPLGGVSLSVFHFRSYGMSSCSQCGKTGRFHLKRFSKWRWRSQHR